MAEPRPAALPPAERTIGQLVAESMRFYGENFWPCLALGPVPAVVTVILANVSRRTAFILSPTLFAVLLSATYVYASVLVLGSRPSRKRLAVAVLAGWIAFAPVPFLALAIIVPAVLWLAAFASLVPVLVVESVSPRGAVPRAWQLARADFLHQIGSLITLAIVVLLTQGVLAFVLRSFGDAVIWIAYFLASVTVSPLLFVGSALLYVDQAGRVEQVAAMPIYILLSRLSQQGVQTLQSNPARLQEVNRDVEELGAKVLHQWATLGEFDFVNVVEAPDTATIAKVSVALGARGSTKIQTLPALSIEEFVSTIQ